MNAGRARDSAGYEPWGWQLDGHDLINNYFVLGDQVVMTPTLTRLGDILVKMSSALPVAFVLCLFPLLLACGPALLAEATAQRPDCGEGPMSQDFFDRTDAGRALRAYLFCSDIDCPKTLEAVRALGGDAVPCLLRILQHGLPGSLTSGLEDRASGLVRLRTIQALGAFADARSIGPLVETLKAVDPLVRAAGARALGEAGVNTACPAIIPLLRDPDELVRETAAGTLGDLKCPEALPALREAASGEKRPHVRRAMEAALHSIQETP